MDFSDILPIGTVCKLKGAKKKIMIIGYKKNNKKLIDFNYIGCQFPEGITSKKGQLYFLYDQIAQIYFMGYNEQVIKKGKVNKVVNSPKNNDVEPKNPTLETAVEKKEQKDIDPKEKELLDSIPTQ